MSPERERIVDVVFERHDRARSSRGVLALAFGVGAHLLVLGGALRGGPSLEAWAADVAVRVHAELTRTEIVELPDETPPNEEPPPSPLVPKAPSMSVQGAPPPSRHEHRATALHQAETAAQAGSVLTTEEAEAPADLTGETFVVGDADAHAGGLTRSDGASPTAVDSVPPSPSPSASSPSVDARRRAPPPDEVDASKPLSPRGGWSCAWPREADDEAIDTQSATVRITVSAEGRVESATLESDPGFGFGRAALECARAMRYSPALDRAGNPTRASASIRVRFWR